MSYRSRSVKRLAKKSKRNFIITLVIIFFLFYASFSWILPNFINGVGFIKNIFKPVKVTIKDAGDFTLAPPVLNIPYEATNTAQIDISGFSSPNYKVKLFIDDKEKQTVDVSDDGSFIFKDISLSLGINNIYGKTIDDKSHQSLPSKTIQINFNNEKPNLSVREPDDGKKIQGGDRKITISGKTDPRVKIFINATQIIVDKDGNFSSDQSLNDGDNAFDIKAQDLASNTTQIQRRVNYSP